MKHLKTFNENVGNFIHYKNYYFNPNDYGEGYTILSDSKENALNSLINYLHDVAGQSNHDQMYEDVYEKWQDSTVDSLPDDDTIDVFGYGEVIETEKS